MITTVVNESTQLKVQFPSFRFFFVHLQSPAHSIDSLFYEKVGILQNTLSANTELLSETNIKLSSKELADTKDEVIKLRNHLSLMNETLHLIKPKVSLCGITDLSSVIADAEISGSYWRCFPSGTNSMIEPDDVSYCYIQAGECVYFDFGNTLTINVIRFRL